MQGLKSRTEIVFVQRDNNSSAGKTQHRTRRRLSLCLLGCRVLQFAAAAAVAVRVKQRTRVVCRELVEEIRLFCGEV